MKLIGQATTLCPKSFAKWLRKPLPFMYPVINKETRQVPFTDLKEEIMTIVVTEANIDSIPHKAGTHVTHCCGKHGCKYDDSDCAVETGEYTQMYACPYCQSVETIQGKLDSLNRELAWTNKLAEQGIIVTGDGEDW